MSPYPHPTRCARHPLPKGEGFKPPCLSEVRAVVPSPIGKRCPEGAEGSVIVFLPFSHKPATSRPVRTFTEAASFPHPTRCARHPLPRGEGFKPSCLPEVRAVFLLPSGEGAPKGRRVRSSCSFRSRTSLQRLAPSVPSPVLPLSRRKRDSISVPSPIGRRWRAAPDEGSALHSTHLRIASPCAPEPSALPLSRRERVQSAPFPGQGPIRL